MNFRDSNINSVNVENVIHVSSLFGSGTMEDVCREIDEYYDMDGNLLFRKDLLTEEKKNILFDNWWKTQAPAGTFSKDECRIAFLAALQKDE
jgi:hypothetical protein